MNIFTKFYLPTLLQLLNMDPSLHMFKCIGQIRKSLKTDSIHKLCLCLKLEHTRRM